MSPPRPTSNLGEHRDEYDHLRPALNTYASTGTDEPARARLLEQLVAGYLPLAANIARRYANRGEPLDDLTQVASVGLLKAIDGYDPGQGHFLPYAIPTMTGEVRRHLRDRTWAMRVPRRIKDLHVQINSAVRVLYQDLGRAPRPSEIASRLGVPVEDVLEVLAASDAYKAASLDKVLSRSAASDSGDASLGDFLGSPDPGFDLVTDAHAVRPYLAALPARERSILKMRFYDDLTQTQIAENIGVSQMHVSRILSHILTQLRDRVITDQPATIDPTPKMAGRDDLDSKRKQAANRNRPTHSLERCG